MIETNNLNILPYESSDLDEIFELLKDYDLTYPAGFKPIPDMKTARFVLQYRISTKQYVKICLKDGTLIGEINFYKDASRRNPKAYQIGFLMSKVYQGHGFMKEALEQFLVWFFKTVDIDILSALTFENNNRSKNTLTSLNFKLDGIRRRYKKMYDGKVFDCLEYSLTKEELERNILLWKKN